MSEGRTLGGVIAAGAASRVRNLWTALPAVVTRYDAARREIDAQPAILDLLGEDESGTPMTKAIPVITHVPVLLPGSGGARVKFPIAVGDTVLLIITSQSLDQWVNAGGQGVDPRDPRRNNIADAVAITGLQAFPDASDATPMIEFTDAGKVEAGGNAALTLATELADLKSRIAAIVPSGSPGDAVLAQIQAAFAAWSAPGTQILKGG